MRPAPEALTDILAGFVPETSDVPVAAIEAAKDLILDTTGVTLAATARPIGRIIISHVAAGARSPDATATILGAGIKVPAPLAAHANGTLANAIDFDEGSHLSTHVLPTALALAEQHGLSGTAALKAFIVGFEAAARLTQVIDCKRRAGGGPTHQGWWHVGLIGPIASAMTAARLLEFDRRATAAAIGIASASCGGFRRNMGTMAKALHSGNAARAGIEAALLAQRGFTSDPTIIEAPLGFLEAVVAPEDRDIAAVTERLGRPFVLEGELRIKRFPACNPAHPLIDAALRLVHEQSVSADTIEHVDADLHPFSLLRGEPTDEEEAGFSGAFVLAATLARGAFTLEELTRETVDDPVIRQLMKRIHHAPALPGEKEMVSLTLRDGRTVETDVRPVRRLTTRADILAKFRRCAEPVVGADSVAQLEESILHLEREPDLARLIAAANARVMQPVR
jgi:2-methylcitrate dehydratase PrpD